MAADALSILRAKHAAAERAAQELAKDLRELERITSKYALPVAEGLVAEGGADASPRGGPDPNSLTSRSREIAARLIRQASRPIPTGELYPAMLKAGLKFGGKNPKAALSGFLSHSPRFQMIPHRGWWMAELGSPDLRVCDPRRTAGHQNPAGSQGQLGWAEMKTGAFRPRFCVNQV